MVTAFHHRRTARLPWRLDMAAVAGTFLAVLTPWLDRYSLKYLLNQPPIQLPYTRLGSPCLPDKPVIMLSVDAQGRIYFSHDNQVIQTETLRQLAACYGAPLNARQVNELRQLPYFGLDSRWLPSYLDLPAYQRRQFQLPGIPYDTSMPQFPECVMLARRLTIQHANSLPYIALRVDARLPMAKVRQVMQLLEHEGLHRFYLVHLGR